MMKFDCVNRLFIIDWTLRSRVRWLVPFEKLRGKAGENPSTNVDWLPRVTSVISCCLGFSRYSRVVSRIANLDFRSSRCAETISCSSTAACFSLRFSQWLTSSSGNSTPDKCDTSGSPSLDTSSTPSGIIDSARSWPSQLWSAISRESDFCFSRTVCGESFV